MICHLCKEDKLSKEFPFEHLTESCVGHPLLHCLRCAAASVKNYKKCSQCNNKVDEENEKYQEYIETLEFLYPNVEEEDAKLDDGLEARTSSSTIVVTTLSGESTTLSYSPNKTILDLKKEIEMELKAPSDQQRLLYQNKELKVTSDHNFDFLKLKDYNVPPNSTLHLMILLYAVPEGLDHVIFDLFWGYTARQKNHGRRDFLDASVFLYSGSEYLDVVDFRHSYSFHCINAVRHSGYAQMDDFNQLGHQKIDVHIKSIPNEIDNLVFTLSAYHSSNISEYPNPSLKFFDAKFPDRLLCSDEMRHARQSQAIIMCSLSKKNGQWGAYSIKSASSGNTKNYSLLKENIARLIRSGQI